ncbi:neutral zinc metallopeptidase [Aestuariimicrobium sp. Y1814]|uniref:neutral zinc metallopeptidase n=1 Tax=Aestuariimicrobium sp. Y1814 TaxID=3418742 RepID=UPI003DA70660
MNDQRPEDWWPYRGPVEGPPADDQAGAGDPTEYLPPVVDGPTQVLPGAGPEPTLEYPPPPQWAAPKPQWAAPPQQWSGQAAPRPQWQGSPQGFTPPQGMGQWPAPPPAPAPPTTPPPPRRAGRAVAVLSLFVVLGVVAGVAVSGFFDRRDNSAQPTTAATTSSIPTVSPTPTPTPTPTPSPSATSTWTPFQVPSTTWAELPTPTPTTRAQRTLQANPLYDLEFPVATTCPTIGTDIALNSQFREVSQQVLDCQHTAWEPVFEQLGLDLDKPELVTFRGSVQTACGTVDDEQSFYCPATSTIYLSEQRFESSQDWWRLHFANTIVHEYLHHVQSGAGILDSAYGVELDEDERTRRVELQAYCMTSRMMLITPGFEFEEDDYLVLKQWTGEGGSETHGSVASRQHWWLRGLDQQTPAGCNTWVVAADQVT